MSLAVILHQTQDIVNIAGVVRAMSNFELRDLRLVSPAEFEVRRIRGIAHKSGEILKRVRHFDELDEALSDRTLVVGMTARQRSAKRNALRPREAAHEIHSMAQTETVAILLGPEDKGLTNENLDRCHRTVTIPTTPDYSSLNLAQAFSILAYELFTIDGPPPLKPPKRPAEPASGEALEQLFRDAEHALAAIEFFKTRHRAAILRTIRECAHRTPLDLREARLFRAMCLEVVRFLERTGYKA